MMRRRAIRRFVLAPVLCLAGGAATTVLVAWWYAANATPLVLSSSMHLMIQFGSDPELFVENDPGVQHRLRDWHDDRTLSRWLEYDVDSGGAGLHLSQTMIGRLPDTYHWTIEGGEDILLRVLSRHIEQPIRYQEAVACGWPWPALRCTRAISAYPGAVPVVLASDTSMTLTRAGARTMPRSSGAALPFDRVLPLVPVWRGLIGDALAFALVPAGLIAAVEAGLSARRRFRRRLNRCPACGYDLSGLPPGGGAAACPECGKERPL